MNHSTSKTIGTMLPLFIVLFIDSMGLGLLFPVLNAVIVDPVYSFLAKQTTIPARETIYGVTVSLFMLSWFFGSAILGDLSDNIGRRKSLLICLTGSFLGYLFSAIGILLHSLTLLIVGRVIAGFTAGSQPIAQAAIVDISPEEHKTRNIGLILLAVSLGFVFGPVFGGLLSNHRLVYWFDFSTPLYFAAIISILNAVFLWAMFHETYQPKSNVKIKLHRAIEVFLSAFKHPAIWSLSIVLLFMIFGWANYFTFSTVYLTEKFKFSPGKNSIFLTFLGVGFSIGCGFLVDFLNQRFSKKQVIVWTLLLSALVALFMVLIHRVIFVWVNAVCIGVTMACAYSTIIALFSSLVGKTEQGWVMGVTGSIMALAFGVTSLLGGVFAQASLNMPMILAAIGIGVAAIVLVFLKIDEGDR